MARFEFRLQSVLNLREKQQNQKELEYAQALRKLEEERAKERALISQRDGCIADLARKISGEDSEARLYPSEVVNYNDFIAVMKERIREQFKVRLSAEGFAETKRKELVEAMREHKTIERLKENAYEEYIVEEKRGEQKQVDEVVSYKFAN